MKKRPGAAFFFILPFFPHPILDVVIDDEVQLLVGEILKPCSDAQDCQRHSFVSGQPTALKHIEDKLSRVLGCFLLASTFVFVFLTISPIANRLDYYPVNVARLRSLVQARTFHLAANSLGLEFKQLVTITSVVYQCWSLESTFQHA